MFGKIEPISMKDLDTELELPMDEDENTGDGAPKKRVKRKKTKEERAVERKIVFWTFILIVGVTIFFWLWPKVRDVKFGLPSINSSTPNSPDVEMPKSGWKNYVEYKL